MTSNQYVTAFFDSESDAEAAVARIEAEGISRDQIRIVAGDAGTGVTETRAEPRDEGFFAALADLFMPDDDRHAYAEGLSRGGYLVSLNTTPENRDRILDILDDEGTVDMDAREESWRAEGWQGYQTRETETPLGMTDDTTAMTGASAVDKPAALHDADEGVIEVVQENLRVGKREVNQGRVRVRSYVVETPVEEDVSLRDETVRLSRTPVDRPVEAGEVFTDRTIEATETAEEAVVSKEARVVEEIGLEKVADTRVETVRDTVRHTEVDVEDERDDRLK
jgi:stress response protein YsnF